MTDSNNTHGCTGPTIWQRTDTPALQAQLSHLLEKRDSLDAVIGDLQNRLAGRVIRDHVGTVNLKARHVDLTTWRRGVLPVLQRFRKDGLTHSEIADKLKASNVPMIRKRSCEWTAGAVATLWSRYGNAH